MYNQNHITWDEHTDWFDRMLLSANSVYWTIQVENKKIGIACITNIDFADSCADWAFYIADEQFRGAGVGSAVELFVTNYVFNSLNLNKINCEVLSWNKSIIRMHIKFGFCSVSKKDVYIQGKGSAEEVECFSMDRVAWIRNKERNLERLKAVGLSIELPIYD